MRLVISLNGFGKFSLIKLCIFLYLTKIKISIHLVVKIYCLLKKYEFRDTIKKGICE